MRDDFTFHSLSTGLVLSILLSACGSPTTSTTVERRNVTTIEAVPEATARSVRPLLDARFRPEEGTMQVTLAKELAGELHAFTAYDEATITVNGRQPHLVAYAVYNVATFGLPLLLTSVDQKARENAREGLIGTETGRTETVTYRIDPNGRPLGRDGITRQPWAGESVQLAIEDGAWVSATTDSTGKAAFQLASMVHDPSVLLDRGSLAVRLRSPAGGTPVEHSVYLGAKDVAALRTVAAAAIYAEGSAAAGRDYAKAAERYRIAAELGDAHAQLALAELYRDGLGVPQNQSLAASWLSRAARQGDTEAQLQLAVMLSDPDFAGRDDAQAYQWSLLAAAWGSETDRKQAVARRNDLARRLKPEQVQRGQAMAAQFRPVAEIVHNDTAPSIQLAIDAPPPPLDATRLRGKAKPNAVALVIGVEDYQRLPPAQYAGRDARAFRDFAVNAMGITPERVRLLVDGQARLLDVQKVVETWLKAEIQGGATDVYVFFSGHGLASDDGRDLYLFPHDGDRAILKRSSIDRAQLIDTILGFGAKSATLFLDTCYSGGTRGDDILIADARPLMIVPRTGGIPLRANVLAAARNDQLSSSYPAARHGLFSYFLMRGMMGEADANGDRSVTLEELHTFTEGRVRREASQRGRDQVPVLAGEGGSIAAVTW